MNQRSLHTGCFKGYFVYQATKYLNLQHQFLDMGFSNSKIKEALLLHNMDQRKALEELMPGV